MLIRTQYLLPTFCLVSKVQDSSLSSDKPLLNGAFCVMEPELWKDVTGFEAYYQVSSHGRVRSKDRNPDKKGRGICRMNGRLLSPGIDRDNYRFVAFAIYGNRKTLKVNRLVAAEFVPNPFNYPIVGHLDNDPSNNYYRNLVWCTQGQNIQYAYDNGRKNAKGKPVLQLDLNGNIIRRFEKLSHVKELGYKKEVVCGVALGKYKTAYGYRWEYAGVNKIDES